jgi:uncharacterized protein YceH (UPF0502 family)
VAGSLFAGGAVMEIELEPVDARVLACLIEKSITTPDYYPLTLNALTAACNQKSNREPVMALAEADVLRSLDRLRDMGLACVASLAGSRMPRYRHRLTEQISLSEPQVAVLCELMLRGPQTPGELRARAGRMAELPDREAVLTVLDALAEQETGAPLVAVLPGRSGQREERYGHLLCGALPEGEAAAVPAEPARLVVRAEDERLAALEERTAHLEDELARLRGQFSDFKHQFE